MAYATEQQLDTKWGVDLVTLVAIDAETGLRSSAKIEAALDAASAIIDSYIGKRYQLPIDASTSGALLLRNLCCDLAMGELSNTPAARNEIVKEAAERALKFLADVAKGVADIPQNPPAGGDGLPTPSPNEAIVAANDRLFSRNRLRDL